MNSGLAKFYLAIIGVLGIIFGAVAAAVSVAAGAATVGILVGMTALLMLAGGVKTKSLLAKIVLGCLLILAFIFLGIAAAVSVRAAAVAVAILAALLAGLGAVIHHYILRHLLPLNQTLEADFAPLDARAESSESALEDGADSRRDLAVSRDEDGEDEDEFYAARAENGR